MDHIHNGQYSVLKIEACSADFYNGLVVDKFSLGRCMCVWGLGNGGSYGGLTLHAILLLNNRQIAQLRGFRY